MNANVTLNCKNCDLSKITVSVHTSVKDKLAIRVSHDGRPLKLELERKTSTFKLDQYQPEHFTVPRYVIIQNLENDELDFLHALQSKIKELVSELKLSQITSISDLISYGAPTDRYKFESFVLYSKTDMYSDFYEIIKGKPTPSDPAKISKRIKHTSIIDFSYHPIYDGKLTLKTAIRCCAYQPVKSEKYPSLIEHMSIDNWETDFDAFDEMM